MRVLIGLLIIGCLAASANVAGAASPGMAGATLILCALFAGGLNLLRALPGSSRSGSAMRQGLGLFGAGLLFLVALGAASGSSTWRAMAAELEQKRQTAEHSIPPILDLAEGDLAEGRLDVAASQLKVAEGRLKALRGLGPFSPGADKLDARWKNLSERLRAVRESAAIASAEAAEKVEGVLGLEQMLAARSAFQTVSPLSVDGKARLAALETRIESTGAQFGAVSQPTAVLEARLLSTPPAKSADSYRLTHLEGALGFVGVTVGKSSGLYLAAEPRPSSLSDSAATSFLELSVGTVAPPPLWKAPPGKGARSLTRSHNGVPVHEGWFDDKLIELWVGDFKP